MIRDEKGNTWYKGNLHTHTTRSDGRKTPEDTIALYRQNGYDFLAMTDHWKPSANETAPNGMLMVAGLLYGYDDPGENDVNKKAHYRLVQTLAGQFREEIGSIICREILSNPPSDPNPTPRTAEFYKTRPCVRMVMTAAGILDDYIAEHPVGTPTKPDMERL